MSTMSSKYVCKFCKKFFPCGRSLGGHIRSHLNRKEEPKLLKPGSKPGYELRENPKKTNKVTNLIKSTTSPSWSTESETGDGLNPNLGKRSSFVVNNTNNSHSSISEVVEQEQEEVAIAMCLIMLSKDVGKWGNVSCDDILLLQANDTKKRIKKEKIQNGSKMKNFDVSTNEFCLDHVGKSKQVESEASWHLQYGLKMKEHEVYENDQYNNKPPLGKRKIDDFYSNKKKLDFEVFEDGIASNDQKSNNHEFSFDDIGNKRSKFECTTCNKVFHSYQALGGHRASHKKQLGEKNSSISKLENIDNCGNYDQQQCVGETSKKVVHKHECPICFRVFSSGQALGGHKRSHLLAINNKSHSENTLVEKSTSPIVRDLLDLNLPPSPSEEETTTCSNSSNGLIKPYWWDESSKHEPILGLISN